MSCFKKIIILLFSTLALFTKAQCGEVLSAWPSSKKINLNSVFILIGKNIPQGKFYLKGGDTRIELGILIWCNGGNGVSQILFSPKQKLRSNTLYTLVNDSNKVVVGINGEEKAAPICWKTTSVVDELAPKIEGFPVLKETRIRDKNKNDLVFRFSFKAREPSPMFVMVICKETSTSSFQVQLVLTQNNSFELTEDKCLGGFVFEEGKYYSCQFQITDASGNVADLGERPSTIIRPEK